MKEMEEVLSDGIRRTNSIYNTAIANKEIEDIQYDPKGAKYFEKFPKIKIPAKESDNDGESSKITLAASERFTML